MIDPETAVRQAINKLKAKKVDLIIVLSQLGEEPNVQLIKNIKGIDILISGGVVTSQDKFTKIDDTILLRPAWQARKLGKIEIDLNNKKIENFNVEQLPLGADVPDDAEVKSLLPVCFSDYDCTKPNFIGTCQNAGKKEATCTFEEMKKLPLLVVKPKNCRTCNTDSAINNIRRLIPNAEIVYADYEDEAYKKLIERLGINMLPAYILTSDIEKDRIFPRVKDILNKKENYYLFKPYFTGISYFAGRPFKKNQLDLFILLRDKRSAKALETLEALKTKMSRKISINIHFLVVEDPLKGFVSFGGLAEIEDAKRSVCVMKYYPQKIWDYLICRTKDFESSWWDKCLSTLKTDVAKIKTCATSTESDSLLRENINLTQELQVTDTPIILLDNQEVFGLTSGTSVGELEGIIKGKK